MVKTMRITIIMQNLVSNPHLRKEMSLYFFFKEGTETSKLDMHLPISSKIKSFTWVYPVAVHAINTNNFIHAKQKRVPTA